MEVKAKVTNLSVQVLISISTTSMSQSIRIYRFSDLTLGMKVKLGQIISKIKMMYY